VSLILEALKKLEREKERSNVPIITAGEAPWSGTRRSLPVWALGLGALGLVVLGAIGGASLLSDRSSPASRPAQAAAAPTVPAPPIAIPSLAPPPQASAVTAPRLRERSPEQEPVSPIPRASAATPRPPAARPAAPVTAADEPRLQAISERDGRRIALISDQIYFEGDRIGDIRVIRIGVGEVEIEWNKARRTLKF
jgi:hypothetical protein